jgi:hypothetical protein
LLKSVLRICAGSESESDPNLIRIRSESALLRIFFAEISLADLVPDPNPDLVPDPELNPDLNPEPNPDSNREPDPNIDPDP